MVKAKSIMEKILTNENKSEILGASGVVVVDFWATWCGPCRALAPTVEQIANEYEGKVTVAKCNVDEQEDISMEYGIRSIPTLIYFKDGKVADKTVGLLPKDEIEKHINALL